MINFDGVTTNITKECNSNWPRIPDHPYRILIIGDSKFGKTNSLFNLISHQPKVYIICLYAKDPYGGKYQLLINKKKLQTYSVLMI